MPQEERGVVFACPITTTDISQVTCQKMCRVPRTSQSRCLGCKSPWRFCIQCILEGAPQPNVVVDVEKGLCRVHRRGGQREEPAEKPAASDAKVPVPEPQPQPVSEVLIPIAALPVAAEPVATEEPDMDALVGLQSPAPVETSEGTQVVGEIVMIPYQLVIPLPGQPRIEFVDVDMEGLIASIRKRGQMQAGTVQMREDGMFQLIDGERRLRACTHLKRPFKAEVKPAGTYASYNALKEASCLANFHRPDHSPIEKALVMLFFQQKLGHTIAEIAIDLGVSTSTVTNHLLILKSLHPGILDLMDPKRQKRPLKMMTALDLTAYKDHPEEQLGIAEAIVQRNLTTIQAKTFILEWAEKLGITKGRGLERKPADRRDILETLLHRMGHGLYDYLRMNEFQLREMFARSPREKYETALTLARQRRDELDQFIEGLEAIGGNLQTREVTKETEGVPIAN